MPRRVAGKSLGTTGQRDVLSKIGSRGLARQKNESGARTWALALGAYEACMLGSRGVPGQQP